MTPIAERGKAVHIVFSAFPAWGRVRSFCVLAARLVEMDKSMIITLILSPNLLDKAKAEILAAIKGTESDNAFDRIRVLASFNADSNDLHSLFVPLVKTYATTYEALTQSQSVSCIATGIDFDAVPPPNIVILDVSAYAHLQATRAITGHTVPIVSWLPGHASSAIRLFGPADRGGHGDLGVRSAERARQSGASLEDIGDSLYTQTNGTVVRIPGVPPMHDWEFFPQELPFSAPVSQMLTMAHRSLKECDAVLTTAAFAVEKDPIEGLKSWFSAWKKEFFVTGPLLPHIFSEIKDISPTCTETNNFLDKALAKHGKISVMLISFGTIFWPTRQEYIEEVLEVLIEKNFPFIICLNASPLAILSETLIAKIEMSRLGLVSKCVNQQDILNHPAAGWFLTHGGHNSVMESLASGIPMICWPMETDQPAAAAHLSENLNVAFELVEVRTGVNGMKPIFRNRRRAAGTREAVGEEFRRVLDECRGNKGDSMRRNAMELSDKLKKSSEEGGSCELELDRFLKKYALC